MTKRSKKMSSNTRAYTAGTTNGVDMEPVLALLESKLQDLRDRRPTEDNKLDERRPKALPVVWIASCLNCTVTTLKKWHRFHSDKREEFDISDRFCEVYELIANELTERISGHLFNIATDKGNTPQALRAQMYLLPKMSPHVWGPQSEEKQTKPQIADIATEVFDAMSEEAKDELERIAEQQDELDRRTDELLKEAELAAQDDRGEDL